MGSAIKSVRDHCHGWEKEDENEAVSHNNCPSDDEQRKRDRAKCTAVVVRPLDLGVGDWCSCRKVDDQAPITTSIGASGQVVYKFSAALGNELVEG